ncbi:hypothetical protein C0Q70_19284 [Pomacea canaliculata]|uniref:Uncharacterized protein n=1 Tax=Pomacea canaliculata TaxID=400727 RepID=A0A2T7NIY8_POMCA|nr:hypothetical protein C0Q70_19284 [Pomacea canaliculata]
MSCEFFRMAFLHGRRPRRLRLLLVLGSPPSPELWRCSTDTSQAARALFIARGLQERSTPRAQRVSVDGTDVRRCQSGSVSACGASCARRKPVYTFHRPTKFSPQILHKRMLNPTQQPGAGGRERKHQKSFSPEI